ncbi:MAG: phage major capsid protein [Firmicutes bacterium]|nr:phage major capsid protein [Bacillota bacterium]
MLKNKINEKKYIERRAEIIAELDALIGVSETEQRAFNEEEQKKYKDLLTEIKDVDAMLKVAEETRAIQDMQPIKQAGEEGREEIETRAFAAYLRGKMTEERADQNLTLTDNGAIIPKTIANKIIEEVKEMAPIYENSRKFNIKGDLVFPVYDDSEQEIITEYADEFQEPESTAFGINSVTLKGYLSTTLCKISKSLVNNSDFDLVSYAVSKMAESVAKFMRRELIHGKEGKMTGLMSTTNIISTALPNVITLDELIDIQLEIPQVLQSKCVWIMSKNTLKAIMKLKNNDGNLLLNSDITKAFGNELLGNKIYIDDLMPDIEAGSIPIIYCDLSGLYVKVVETPTIDVLREKYATQHAIGLNVWLETDSKVVEPQKIVVLKMAAEAAGK